MPVEIAVLRHLFKFHGAIKGMSILLKILWWRVFARPFRDLAKADSKQEAVARRHVADAIVLFRALGGAVDSPVSAHFANTMKTAAQAFLSDQIGHIEKETYLQFDVGARRDWLRALIHRFPNAQAEINETSDHRVAFTVVRCRYVELAKLAGYPQLAPVFCVGDAAFFEAQPAGLIFNRDISIAEGGSSCPFVLTVEPDSSPLIQLD